ncbi:MAG: HAMP domain-containing histidine kinase [Gemmatimonadetes bacterium]|nr:HAMP domain-containing histidine kinase [Gemmatimonadota bacterium]
MTRANHRKRALFFLAAVLLPSGVLVGTSVRLIRQERELAVRRAAEERAALALRIGQTLLANLRGLEDRIASAPSGPEGVFTLADSEPAVLTVAATDQVHLVFPWEMSPDPSEIVDPRVRARYARSLERGETAEYRNGNPTEAAELYAQAAASLEAALPPDGASAGKADESTRAASVLFSEARVHQGRALLRAGRTAEARAVFLLLAESPPSLTDREGMPFSVYGLEGLRQAGAGPHETLRLLRKSLGGPMHLGLPALLALRDVARDIAKDGGDAATGGDLQEIEDAISGQEAALGELERLRSDLPGLAAAARGRMTEGERREGPRWVAYGEEPWLVGFPRDRADELSRVIVVRPARLLGSAGNGIAASDGDPAAGAREDEVKSAADPVTLLPAGASDGERLGQDLEGLRASFPAGYPPLPERGGVEGWFFRLLLPVILLLTAFTAYLAWRDVRRETEAVRLRSQFVSSVTHELKTPLTSIRMFAETLRLGRHSGPDQQQQYLDTVVHETERLSRLINNVLDFARIDRGEKTYHMAPTDVGAAAREAARVLAYPLDQGRYTLTTEIEEGLPAVEADADALTQALLNLLSNATKFSEEGSDIALRVFREEDQVLLQVEDHGPGIDPQEQEAIFRDFYRTADAERRGIPGTGLGLSLVSHVAHAHGGSVDLESEVGRGSAFTVRIPIRARTTEAPPEKDSALSDSDDSASGLRGEDAP